jgi:hypothetical protein
MSANKCVRVTYTVDETFCIPSNIDLDNKEQVAEWFIRRAKLHIRLKNGKTMIVDGNGCIYNADFEYHDDNSEEILDAEECNRDDDDEGFEPVDVDVNPEDVLTCELCGKNEEKNTAYSSYHRCFSNHKALTGNPVCLGCFVKYPLSCIQEQPKPRAVVNGVFTKLPAVEEGQPHTVKKFEQDGKKYLVSRNYGTVFDYKKYVNEDEQVVVGTFDFDTQKVILQEAEVAKA